MMENEAELPGMITAADNLTSDLENINIDNPDLVNDARMLQDLRNQISVIGRVN
jgi:hypothetical protein